MPRTPGKNLTEPKFGYPLRQYDLLPYFGIKPGHRLPSEGHPWILIQNVRVWIAPKTDKQSQKHRLLCECPDCGKTLTTGTLFQHRATSRICREAQGQ